jgi:protein SCO1/2
VAGSPALTSSGDETSAVLDNAFRLVVVLGALLGVLLVVNALRPTTDELEAFAYKEATAAPPIVLTDPDERPFSLDSLRGGPVLVFFGYTHCPDVCPATIGHVSQAMEEYGPAVRALFVTIDPERDTTTWLKEYAAYLPAGMMPLTGSAAEIRAVADDWGVRYARVETDGSGEYAMSHTAEVYLVDATGRLRAHFPFGTEGETIAAVLRRVAATYGQQTSPLPSPPPSTAPGGAVQSVTPAPPGSLAPSQAPTTAGLRPEVRSSSVWSGGASPVILALYDGNGNDRLNDETLRVTVQVVAPAGSAVGPAVEAVAVRPPGVTEVSFVAFVDIPTPGRWDLAVTAERSDGRWQGAVAIAALDPGATAVLGGPAPDAHTPTIDDAGGVVRAVTTDPAPDLRLYRRSTTDALAGRQPFVLIVDSPRFKVSSACGRALLLGRYLVDRWPDIAFIHLEPLRYAVVTDTPTLEGTLENPRLTSVVEAWGIGGAPWGARSMPWIFIVDGNGAVRAKYEGVVGSEDVDVILSLIAQGR